MFTLYEIAKQSMYMEIEVYQKLVSKSDGFKKINASLLKNKDIKRVFSAGIHESINKSSEELINDYIRKSAVPFDIENAVSVGVYESVRKFAETLYNEASTLTNGFKSITSKKIRKNPQFLPVFQQLYSQISKAQLKKLIGNISDQIISEPASERFCKYLKISKGTRQVNKNTVLQRMESTIEGIVRDLVGRVLLEEIVATSLKAQKVPFLREGEYSGISGVVYDNRSDFVVPNEKAPIAFIEVRKSSSRHASLYAKDKMFSAINWKGKHKNLIAAIVVDGEWTKATLQTMSQIFDYVIPIHESEKLAGYLKKACAGDKSIQKWIINFSVREKSR